MNTRPLCWLSIHRYQRQPTPDLIPIENTDARIIAGREGL